MVELPFNPKTELFLWGPIPGRFLFPSVFVEVNYKYFCQQYLGENWSETLFLFKNGQMVWINDFSELRESGRRVFWKFMFDKIKRARLYKKWQGVIKELTRLEKKIDELNLRKLSNTELLELWQKFHKIYLQFWVDSTAPELGNYGADQLLEEKLKNFVPMGELGSAMEILTAPVKPSFYQKEEIDLFKATDLKKHQQKYFWIKNSYAGATIASLKCFAERQSSLRAPKGRGNPGGQQNFAMTKRRKLEICKQYGLSNEVVSIANAISDCIAWQDERKGNIFKALHYQDLMAGEVARRFKCKKDDLLNAWFWEIDEILKGKNLKKKLNERKNGFGVDFFKSYKNLSVAEKNRFWKIYTEADINKDTKEFSGLVISRGQGKIRGKVRIVLDPRKKQKFDVGDILVAPMTSPEYIFVMRRAGAIITDTGGFTSHAAIVSRELGVSCIVGTKIATKVLKDGDVVEVNAQKGVVTVIARRPKADVAIQSD
jgi:phosphohistidine swiveling domain-containing protein